MAPHLLEPLTDLLVRADVARIHVLDIPDKTFAAFADPQALAAAIPDLKRYGDKLEVWSELVLVEPLSVVDAPAPAAPVSVEKPAAEKPDAGKPDVGKDSQPTKPPSEEKAKTSEKPQ